MPGLVWRSFCAFFFVWRCCKLCHFSSRPALGPCRLLRWWPLLYIVMSRYFLPEKKVKFSKLDPTRRPLAEISPPLEELLHHWSVPDHLSSIRFSAAAWDYIRLAWRRDSPLWCVKACLGTWTRVTGKCRTGAPSSSWAGIHVDFPRSTWPAFASCHLAQTFILNERVCIGWHNVAAVWK